jgi:phosphoenolpyruvate synthase/pyruvate phosphate dikinase
MENKVLNRDILEARQKHCYVRWFDNDIEVKTDNPDSLIAAYLFKKNLASAKFEGIIAAAGKYVGKVKVLHSANEINKVKSGDILVAAMTSPDYVPAMRRAGAIITDEGGVMCHAAIVSRELGIPCVVGTGNATKLLHDGEIIEVNANHNSVRIIKC